MGLREFTSSAASRLASRPTVRACAEEFTGHVWGAWSTGPACAGDAEHTSH